MEIISDVYGDLKAGERTSEFRCYDDFCTIVIQEGAGTTDGIFNCFKIRFNTNRPNDLLLLQQLHSDIEKAVRFIIDS
jgi:hypothetical protein